MGTKKFITKNGLLTSETQFVDAIGDVTQSITLSMDDTGTLSFIGTNSGQLFSVTDNMAGTIFSVNDISGVPSIEVEDDGTVTLAEFSGNILVGTDTDNGTDKLQVQGKVNANVRSDLSQPTVSSTTTLDFNYNNFMFTLNQNTTLEGSNIANNIGATGSIIINQTGSYTVGLDSVFLTPNGAPLTTPQGIGVINYFVVQSDKIICNYMSNFQ